MASEEVKQRRVEAQDQEFIEQVISESNQELLWQGWVTLYTKGNAAAKKLRILVISNFRIATIKHGRFAKRSTRQSWPIMDLELISVKKDDERCVHLIFASRDIDIISEQSKQIVQSLIVATKAIKYNFPNPKMPRLDVPGSFFQDLVLPEPDTQDGMIATYLAKCDYLSYLPQLSILDYLMSCFSRDDHTFDLSDCFLWVEKPTITDIEAIATALHYNRWFTEFVSIDYDMRDEGLAALSVVLESSPHLQKLILINTHAGRTGFGILSEKLIEAQTGIKFLNVSKNNLCDSGIKTLMDALASSNSKIVLETLSVQSCSFSSKGYRALVDVIHTEPWLKGLKVLDVSDNSAGKLGTPILAEFLQDTHALEQLYAMKCDLHFESLFPSFNSNPQWSNEVLNTLNISGNKMTPKCVAMLCDVMKQSQSLAFVYLAECDLSKQCFIDIFDAAAANPHGVKYWLELSGNDLGGKGAKEVAEALTKHKPLKNIHTLVLSNNNLGGEGVTFIVEALTGTYISTLVLDNNIKVGLLNASKAKEACEAVARFLNSTGIKEFSFSGDDSHYLKSHAYPIIEAMKANSTIRHFDLSRNRLGDEGIKLFCEVLKCNKTLTSFTLERNRVQLAGIRDLHAAVMENTTLLDFAIPMIDIAQNALLKSNSKAAKEMRNLLIDFESAIERNRVNLEEVQRAKLRANPEPQLQDENAELSRMIKNRKKHQSRTAVDIFDAIGRNAESSSHNLSAGESLIKSARSAISVDVDDAEEPDNKEPEDDED